jgi:hypothetical protein
MLKEDLLMLLAFLSLTACTGRTASMNQSELTDFATRYAAAWSSQNPQDLASFYAFDGSLTVNAGAPSVGRVMIAATAKEYMRTFPDMVVKMDSVSQEGSHVTSIDVDRDEYRTWRHGQVCSY